MLLAQRSGHRQSHNQREQLADYGVEVGLHFYPYFDVVQTDWRRALTEALTQAAVDPDPPAFTATLQRLIARLYDGHGRALWPYLPPQRSLPLVWDWVEGELVNTALADGADPALGVGNPVAAIDGVDAADALAAEEERVSGAPAGDPPAAPPCRESAP